jgi:hypothetical protein
MTGKNIQETGQLSFVPASELPFVKAMTLEKWSKVSEVLGSLNGIRL